MAARADSSVEGLACARDVVETYTDEELEQLDLSDVDPELLSEDPATQEMLDRVRQCFPTDTSVAPPAGQPVDSINSIEPSVEASVSLIDNGGYTWRLEYSIVLGDPVLDIANARPGEAYVTFPDAATTVTIVNTTEGRILQEIIVPPVVVATTETAAADFATEDDCNGQPALCNFTKFAASEAFEIMPGESRSVRLDPWPRSAYIGLVRNTETFARGLVDGGIPDDLHLIVLTADLLNVDVTGCGGHMRATPNDGPSSSDGCI